MLDVCYGWQFTSSQKLIKDMCIGNHPLMEGDLVEFGLPRPVHTVYETEILVVK